MATTAVDGAKAALSRWEASRPGRALFRFNVARGSVLAAGIAYYGVFSIFPALAVGFTLFARFLGDRQDLQEDLVDYVNKLFGIPIIAMEPGQEGLVTVDQLIQTTSVGIAGIVSGLVLLYTGLGWLSATRQGIRAVFAQPATPNFILGKLRDLVVLAALGALMLVSVSASVVTTTFTGNALDWLGISRGSAASLLLQVTSGLAVFIVDLLILLLFFRILTGVALPMRDLIPGSAAGATGLYALTLAGGLLLRKVSGNQFLAAFGVIIGLLLWVNFAARIALVAAAWSATTAAERGHLPPVGVEAVRRAELEGREGDRVSPGGEDAGGGPPAVSAEPTYGVRSADRVTLAAGAVLGATAMVAVRTVSRAGRAVLDVVRPGD